MIGQKGFEVSERGGGVEQHVRALSLYLGKRGHEVTVYGRGRYGPTDRTDLQTMKGVTVRYVPTIYRKNLEAIVHTFLCTMDAMFRDVDVFHYHGVGPSTLAWIPRLFKPKARVVCTFHSQDRFHQKWSWPAKLYLWLGEFAACYIPHATIAVSHVIQVYVREVYGRRILYIPNGAEIQEGVGSDRLGTFGLESKKYILNVGRLVPHKGVGYLIEAFKNNRRGPWRSSDGLTPLWEDLKLVIVGAAGYGSKYEEKLKALAEGRDDILFLGYQTGEVLRQLYAHAYLFVQPSEAEGLPVVVLEAMSYGRPVLVSDIPANLEAIHHAGFTFKNKDVEDLTAQLSNLLEHPEVAEESARKTKEVVRKEFNWEMIAVHTEAVYLSIRRRI